MVLIHPVHPGNFFKRDAGSASETARARKLGPAPHPKTNTRMPTPIWSPGPERIERANLHRFMRFCREEAGKADLNSYAPLWQFSVDQPERFWTLLWDFCGIKASGAREPVHDAESGAGWFPQIRLNFAQNILRFDDDRAAVLQPQADGSLQRVSYSELRARVGALAAALKADGVGAGDCVAAALDNRLEALVAMLASASLGAVWCGSDRAVSGSVFARRCTPLQPKVVFLAASRAELGRAVPDAGRLVLVDDGVDATADGGRVVGLQAYADAHAGAALAFTATAFEHPLYVGDGSPAHPALHGAGGTLIQHLKELVLHLDSKREDKVLVLADGASHAWYWAVSTLATGATLILQPPPAGDDALAATWNMIDSCAVSLVIGDAGWLQATARAGLCPRDGHRLFALKTIVCTGTLPPPELVDFVYAEVKDRLLLLPAPSSDGLTGCFTLGAPLLPVQRELPQHRALGMHATVLDAGAEAAPGQPGTLACRLPFPSLPIALHDDPDRSRFRRRYLAGHPQHVVGTLGARLAADGTIELGDAGMASSGSPGVRGQLSASPAW
jgi:acetoacetyl-CoA synthetase